MAPHQMETLPPRPRYVFTPASPVVDKLASEGELIEAHYYNHLKLGDSYRYKLKWDGTVWWMDVTVDGEGMQVWRIDGANWFEGKRPGAGGDEEDEE